MATSYFNNIYKDTHRKKFAVDRLEKLSSKILGMVVNGKVARKRKFASEGTEKKSFAESLGTGHYCALAQLAISGYWNILKNIARY